MLNAHQILVPTDFSALGHAALEAGAALARASRGRLHLLHVVDTSLFGPPYIPQGGFIYPKDELETQRHLEALRANLEDVEVELAARVGNPAEEIVAYAASHGIDLICISTHGRRGLAHAVLGSTTEAVVRLATCPVLSMRGKPDQAAGS